MRGEGLIDRVLKHMVGACCVEQRIRSKPIYRTGFEPFILCSINLWAQIVGAWNVELKIEIGQFRETEATGGLGKQKPKRKKKRYIVLGPHSYRQIPLQWSLMESGIDHLR
ncbi:unnamed protein product [Musa hybrid cultivar]